MWETVSEVLFIRNLLNETFDIKFENAVRVYEDNSGAITIAKFGNIIKNS